MIDVNRRPENCSVTVVTLYTLLPPLPVAWLPVALVVAVPSPSSAPPDAPGHVPTVDIHVRWLDDSPSSDSLSESSPSSDSPWRPRVEAALAHATTFEEMLEWWSEACNGVTMDLSIDLVDAGDLDGAHVGRLLAEIEDTLFAEHCILSAEIEPLALEMELAQA